VGGKLSVSKFVRSGCVFATPASVNEGYADTRTIADHKPVRDGVRLAVVLHAIEGPYDLRLIPV
jgi:hypothetical protein